MGMPGFRMMELVVQDGAPSQLHDLLSIVHASDQAQAQVIVDDLLQGVLGEGIGSTELHAVPKEDKSKLSA